MNPKKPENRKVFSTFDGLRGIAALLVVTRHVGPYFGPLNSPESFLAVDLFFLLSGFVIAHAYGSRLATTSFFKDFVKIRLIRLYPLYFAGLIFALIYHVYRWHIGDQTWTQGLLLSCFALALIFLPGPTDPIGHGYSLNAPSWTLLPEILLNFLYARFYSFLSSRRLIGLITLGAIGSIVAECQKRTLDVGYPDHTEWAAPFRMGFSFFLGILLETYIKHRNRFGSRMALFCLGCVFISLTIHPPAAWRSVYELSLVFIGFPAIVILAAQSEAQGRLFHIFHWLGLISYGVYCLHVPIGFLLYEILKHENIIDVWYSAPYSGFAYLIVISLLAYGLDRIYDQPVRRILTRLWLKVKDKPV